MAASNDLKDKIISHFLRNVSQTPATTWFLALFTDDPGLDGDHDEVDASDYARQAITFIAPLNGVTYNDAKINFGTPVLDWGTITHFGIFSAVSGGDCILIDELDTQLVTDLENDVVIQAGALKVTIG